MIFFDEKIKVEKKIGSSYRCRILSGIDFSHSWSDLTTPRGSTKKYTFYFPYMGFIIGILIPPGDIA